MINVIFRTFLSSLKVENEFLITKQKRPNKSSVFKSFNKLNNNTIDYILKVITGKSA